MLRILFAVCVLLGVCEFGRAVAADEPVASPKPVAVKSPLSPEESLKHLVLADPNLVIEIVAAEPEVIDPVSMQFDEHGRLWVVEMRDYPTGPKNAPPPLGGPDAKPLSRIKLLEDKDGDGRFETAHVFADNLLFATGVQPWDGGVIVTLAGEVAYFKDTDGDHKADVRETWFTGFAQANTQLRANHPTFGPDGWIYVANGLRGGNVIAVKKDWPSRLGLRPDPSGKTNAGTEKKLVGTESQPTGVSHDPANPVPVSLTGRDFKFDPLTGRYEAISGNGQFGLTFDAWGNRFVCDNRHPCRHVIFEEDFIRRCPHVAFPAVVHDVIPPDDKNKVFPLTSAWTTSNLHAGTFTASCGVCVYTGDWLPEEFRGNVFVCEPTGNLVQRAILEPDGVTFKSRNPYQRSPVAPRQEKPNAPTTPANKSTPNGRSESTARSADLSRSDRATDTQEFLASRDDWFRPVDLQNGPDGALYVVDMYRAVIEHPEWVPDELKNRPDTWLGNDKGRIYRIRPRSPVAPRQEPPNARTTSEKPTESTARSAGLSRSDRATLGKPIVVIANLEACFNSTNGWHRLTASRVAHQQSWREPLADISFQRSEAQLLAIRSGQLHRLTSQPILISALADNDEHVRAEAVRVAYDSWLRLSNEAELVRGQELLQQFVGSESSLVRFQAVQGIVHSDEVTDLDFAEYLAGFACFQSEDRWLRMAMLGAASHVDAGYILRSVLDKFCRGGSYYANGLDERKSQVWLEPRAEFIAQLCEQTAFNASKRGNAVDSQAGDETIARLLGTLSAHALGCESDAYWFELIFHGISGVSNGLARNGSSISAKLRTLPQETTDGVNLILEQATKVAREPGKTRPAHALLATRLLRIGEFAKVGSTLNQCAETSTDQSLRLTAVESFASFQRPEVTTWLIGRYSSETPAIRRAILSSLLTSKERQLALLGAIAEGKIAATEIDPVRAKQLTDAKDEAVREKARQVLAAAAPASRQEVLAAYQPALTLKADPQRGREVFQKNCVTCHRIGDLGVNVAPDISDTRTKKPEQLLLDILDPNRAIDANYFAYAVVTKDGKTESGVIASESSNSITLKQPEGKVLTLLRTDIDELRNTGLSLMPVGMEKNIDKQQMADLIFWLKNWRYLKDNVPATSLSGK